VILWFCDSPLLRLWIALRTQLLVFVIEYSGSKQFGGTRGVLPSGFFTCHDACFVLLRLASGDPVVLRQPSASTMDCIAHAAACAFLGNLFPVYFRVILRFFECMISLIRFVKIAARDSKSDSRFIV